MDMEEKHNGNINHSSRAKQKVKKTGIAHFMVVQKDKLR
jgi:hypothetical protein